ncbi:SNF2-related protein [Avibacterium avium]|uniref:SNF2-related protein n=6 Tax=Avibacterium avium TaxID=751 RepID=UPI003BF7B6B9
MQSGLISSFEDDNLELSDKQVYHLLNDDSDTLSRFDLPKIFDGYIEVKMKGLPIREDCKFLISYFDNKKRELSRVSTQGCLLEVANRERYLLPEEFFEIEQLNEKLKSSYDEALCWKIIEITKNHTNDRITFKGLSKDESIINVHHVSIDLHMNPDGSATPIPRMNNLSNKAPSLNQEKSLLVISDVINNHQVRYIASKQIIQAYQRIQNIGRIPKENIAKFQENPIAFILEGDESENDLPINVNTFRIIGMGEPYVGYFGSRNLDSPLSPALSPNDPQSEQLEKEINKFCEKASIEQIDNYIDKINMAQSEGSRSIDFENIEIFAEQYNLALELLSNERARKISPSGDVSPGKEESLGTVIQIDPNDTDSISLAKTPSILSAINQNNLNPSNIFEGLAYQPKSYQIAGVNWLIDLYTKNLRGGILADDMGLGKTYQIIAFIYFLLRQEEYQGENQKRILIVAPAILLDNWINEFHKFLPEELYKKLRIYKLRSSNLGRIKEKKNTQEGSYNTFDIKTLLNKDIILTSYATLANYQFSFVDQQFNFGCIIFDEAHNIKNPNAKISQAAKAISSLVKFNVLLTGTPIENELRDLWTLFDVFAPEHFGSWTSFKEEFVNVSEVGLDEKLRQRCSNYLLRRLKKDYLGKELPKKIEKIHEVVFSRGEQDLYESYRDSRVDDAITKIHKLRSFSLHKDLVRNINDDVKLEDFSKSKKLIEILEQIKNNKEKAIIFVMRRTAQDLLCYGLNKHFGLNIQVINGDNSNNAELLLQNFRDSVGFNVIILSTLAAGVGLTVIEANHVIHYERWWNASKEDQASDRVYRIGQSKDVFIHHIIGGLPNNTVSIDQAVHQLISQKRETAGFLIPPKNVSPNEIANEGTISSTPLSLEEKLKLLTWSEFEDLVAEIYRRQGYSIEMTRASGSDYGADVIAYKDNEKLAIQCKHSAHGYTKDQEAIYQLVTEAKDLHKPTKLIAVCNTKFSKTAHREATRHNVELIEMHDLLKKMQELCISL